MRSSRTTLRHWKPLAAAFALISSVALSLGTLPTAESATVQSPGLVAGKTLSGGIFDNGGTAATAEAFGAWRGAPIRAVTAYTPTDSWRHIDLATAKQLTGRWAGLGAHMIWSVPLIPLDGSSSLATAATGAYNYHYKNIATALVAGGDANATIRVGWEFTGNWYTWSALKQPATFAAAYRQAVTAMRAVAGQHFSFDWSPALARVNPTAMYPGDAYVDTMGFDTFDRSWNTFPPSDHAAVWNYLMTAPYSWDWMVNFAKSHGKRLSIPEWGLSYQCGGHGGNDDPYFIEQMHNFIATHDVAFESYFETDENSCSKLALTDGIFPNSAAEYKKLFGAGSGGSPAPAPTTKAPTPAPTTKAPTPAPTTTAPTAAGTMTRSLIRISAQANRGADRQADGQAVSGLQYIFLDAPSGTVKVQFYLDRATSASPTHTEGSAPWDLMGTSYAVANGWNASSVAKGWHSVAVVATLSNGSRESATAWINTH